MSYRIEAPYFAELKDAIIAHLGTVWGANLPGLQRQFPEYAGVVEHALVELMDDGRIAWPEWGVHCFVMGSVVRVHGMVQGRLL